MQKRYKQFLHSFVAVPVLAASFALTPASGMMAQSPLAAAISPDKTGSITAEEAHNQEQLITDAAKVDAYFARYDRPAEGYGLALVTTADKYNLPRFALAGMLQIESSGLAHACPLDKENGLGWNSCHGTNFKSVEEAIETVAQTISGNSSNPKLAAAYKGKTFEQELVTYNGYGVNVNYVPNIKSVMSQIERIQVSPDMLATVVKAKA